MTEKQKPRRLSETVVAGTDYAAKVKISDVLDHDVVIVEIEAVSGSKEFALIDPDTGEITVRDYWNVIVDDGGVVKTFSTGAVPIDKVLRSLQAKIDSGEAELPLIACFKKEGRTFVVC